MHAQKNVHRLSLKPDDKRILEQLLIYRKMSFNDLRDKAKEGSPRKLQRQLTIFKKEKLVYQENEKEWKLGMSKWYCLTQKGEKYIQDALILCNVNDRPEESTNIMVKQTLQSTIDDPGNPSAFEKTNLTHKITVTEEVPVEVILWLKSVSQEGKKVKQEEAPTEVLEYLKKNFLLDDLASRFVNDLKYAFLEVRKARYQRLRDDLKPFQFDDVLKQEEEFLKMRGMVLLHFDGTKIAEKINWAEEYSRHKESDRVEREAYEKYKQAISKSGSEQDEWIIDQTLKKVKEIEFGQYDLKHLLSSIFPDRTEEIVSNPWRILDELPKLSEALERELFGLIYSLITYDYKTKDFKAITEKERNEIELTVKRVFDGLLEEGLIEFVPVYLPKLNREKARARYKKQFEKGKDYPSPTTVPYPLDDLFRALGI